MSDIRCECGKIICESDNEFIVIKCRHCKRFTFIKKVNVSQIVPKPHFVDKLNSQSKAYPKRA